LIDADVGDEEEAKCREDGNFLEAHEGDDIVEASLPKDADEVAREAKNLY